MSGGQLRACLLVIGTVTIASGCATIGYGEPTIKDTVLHTQRTENATESAVGAVRQSGDRLELAARQACDVFEVRTIERTGTSEAENLSPAADWLIAGVGMAAIVTGTVLVIDAGSTFPNDTSSRQFNDTGPDAERGYGIGFLVAGAGLMSIPVIDVFRANATKVEVQEVRDPGEPVGRVPCKGRPLANAQVVGTVTNHEFPLGVTDAQGVLQVHLPAVVPTDRPMTASSPMQIKVANTVIGTADLSALVSHREAEAWAKLDVEACRNPTTTTSCNAVSAFLRMYPGGQRSGEAQALLAEAEPKLEALADDEMWDSIDLAACTKTRYEEPNEIAAACQPIMDYQQQYPSGRHAKEAQAALERGSQRQHDLVLELQRQREREIKQREAQQRAEERKEEAAERKRCRAQCKIGCSHIMYRNNFAMCYSGCVEAQGCSE